MEQQINEGSTRGETSHKESEINEDMLDEEEGIEEVDLEELLSGR